MIKLIMRDYRVPLAERESFFNEISGRAGEGVFIHTCNRSELYSGSGTVSEDIVRHLFNVVSGLDSVIVGETSIRAQVKEAYIKASDDGILNKDLHKLFQRAFYVSRRVRSETNISRGAVSHSSVVVDIILKKIKDIENLNISLIGANNLNENIIKFLTKKGAKTIFLTNRTYHKSHTLSLKYGCMLYRLDNLKELLNKTDILISATRAPRFIVNKENFPIGRKMHIFDLAVPRDISDDVALNENVSYYDISEIEKSVDLNLLARKDELELASEIVNNEVLRYISENTLKDSIKG